MTLPGRRSLAAHLKPRVALRRIIAAVLPAQLLAVRKRVGLEDPAGRLALPHLAPRDVDLLEPDGGVVGRCVVEVAVGERPVDPGRGVELPRGTSRLEPGVVWLREDVAQVETGVGEGLAFCCERDGFLRSTGVAFRVCAVCVECDCEIPAWERVVSSAVGIRSPLGHFIYLTLGHAPSVAGVAQREWQWKALL